MSQRKALESVTARDLLALMVPGANCGTAKRRRKIPPIKDMESK